MLLSGAVIAGLMSIVATGGGGTAGIAEGIGTLSLGLTDAATDDYKAVYVTIKEVSVHTSVDEENAGDNGDNGENGGDETGSWKVIAEPNKTYNLLELVNSVVENLGLGELQAGHYTQMRLLLGSTADDELNILGEAHPYPNYVVSNLDEYQELKIPSGYQTGIKLVHEFDVQPGVTTELILDFDASKSIVTKNNGLLLKPTIKVTGVTESKVIQGRVVYDEDGEEGETEPIGVAGVYVSAQIYDPGAVDPKDEVVISAGTITNDEGYFSLRLDPGTYYLVAYRDYREGENNYLPACQMLTVDLESAVDEPEINLGISEAGGAISGNVEIADGGQDQSVGISFRQSTDCGDGQGDVQIEITSVNVANGGSYSVTLPEGTYSIVASTEDHDTQISILDTGFTFDLIFPPL